MVKYFQNVVYHLLLLSRHLCELIVKKYSKYSAPCVKLYKALIRTKAVFLKKNILYCGNYTGAKNMQITNK